MYFENIPVFSELNLFSILFRIALALILGGALGIEREQKQHPAGFRTYVIVCLGATLACITNLYMCERLGGTDPARIPAPVISGIGFLGAGTILVTRNNHVRGLTTAAGLWCCATIGIAVGSGFYCGAVLCTVMIIFSLRILSRVDKRLMRFNKYISIYAEYQDSSFIKNLIEYCNLHNYELHNLEIYPTHEQRSGFATFYVRVQNPIMRQTVLTDIRGLSNSLIIEEIR